MLNSQASAATPGQILPPKSCANTAAATSGNGNWVDVRGMKGEVLVTQITGAFTGTVGQLRRPVTQPANTRTSVSTLSTARRVARMLSRVCEGRKGLSTTAPSA